MTESVSVREVRGSLSELLQNLSGPDGSKWASALARLLIMGTDESALAVRPRPWQTVALGKHHDGQEYLVELMSRCMSVNEKASDMLRLLPVNERTEEVTLVRMSVHDLALDNGVSYEQIYERAKTLGLIGCPPEVGPALRLQYAGQPKGEKLLIATEPFTDATESARLFELECEKGVRWLRAVGGGRGGLWGTGAVFVFVDPSQ
jgi:hypothetical protein